jgi:hypothetical protein
MRWLVLVLAGVVVGCGSQDDGGGGAGAGASPFPAAQQIIDRIAARHADLRRLTLHAVPAGKTECLQLASTMPERRGKPSDPEDREALKTGIEVVLDEPGAIDVTVPILKVDDKPTAVAGVTLTLAPGAEREAAVTQARTIAQELEKEIQAAGGPLW